jgi:L-amino acid N-acyltransferase YncA
MEPDNPDDWPRWFSTAGFSPLATYFSALAEDLLTEDSRIPRTVARLEKQGVHWRPLNLNRFTDELRHIYDVSRVSFQTNFLYTPITEKEFLAQYEPIQAHVQPELVLLAQYEGRPVGFVFGIPDLAQARRGPVDTVIVKTVAVVPGRTCAGLGNVLVAQCHLAARTLGFRRAIHALMHETNNSINLSAHYARPFRRYTLFARETGSTTRQ